MKKILLFFVALTAVFTLTACGKDPVVDEAPVITGAADVTIEKGTAFKQLEGVKATDAEDGDLTSDIEVSGTVFASAEGVYTLTYTVTDSAGNKTEVERKVTVVYTDVEAPVVAGAGDVEIVVGQAFDPKAGVTSFDTVDGDLTSDIVVEGTVDVFVPGEQTLTYKSTDKTGNTFTGTRKVTVGFGRLVFADNNLVSNGDFATDTTGWVASAGSIAVASEALEVTKPDSGSVVLTQTGIEVLIDTDATETMVRVTFDAKGAGESILVGLKDGDNVAEGSTARVELTDTVATYNVYLKVTTEMSNGELSLDLGEMASTITLDNIVVNASSTKDIVVPEVRGTDSVVFIPIDSTDAVVSSFLLNGVSAVDDLDGLITDSIVVTETVDTSVLGLYIVEYKVTDAAGNETKVERIAVTVELVDIAAVSDPGFDGTEISDDWGTEGAGGKNTPSIVDGALVMDIGETAGEWTSHTKMWVNSLGTGDFKEGQVYILKFDAKAERVERKINIRAGLGLNGDPWIADFTGGNTSFGITTEWDTYYVVFTADQMEHEQMLGDVTSQSFKFEVNMGVIDWSEEEKNNDVSIDNFYIYEVNTKSTTHIKDEDFSEFGTDSSVWSGEAGGTGATFTVNTDGELEVAIGDNPGGWASEIKLVQTAGETEFVYGHVYRMDITVKADKARKLEVKIGDKLWADPWMDIYTGGLVHLNVTEEMATYSVYFVADKEGHASASGDEAFEINMGVIDWSEEEKNNTFTFESISVTEYVFSGDTIRPVITGMDLITYYLGETAPDYTTGVVATDDIDGDISANVVVDSSNVDLTTPGTYTVTYTATDAAGNETTETRSVDVLDPSSPSYIDLLALEGTDSWIYETVGGGDSTAAMNNGVYEVTLGATIGDWASATKVKVLDQPLAANQLYKLTIKVKADTARKMAIRWGEPLDAEPWYNDYQGSTHEFGVTTEYQTIEILFYTDQGVGSNTMEIQMGTFDWVAEEKNNTFYIESLRIDKVEDNDAPGLGGDYADLTVSTDVPFDPMAGLWATDDVKAVGVTVAGTVDQTTPGTYTLTYTVTDFVGKTTDVTRTVTVVDFTGATSTDLLSSITAVENGTFVDNNGVLELSTGDDIGGWSSYVKTKVESITVEQGKTYRLKLVLKSATTRNIALRLGDSLWADPWIDNYTGGFKVLEVDSTDFATYEMVFTADKEGHASTNGYNVLEIQFGPLTWGGEEYNNTIYVQSFVLEELPSSN